MARLILAHGAALVAAFVGAVACNESSVSQAPAAQPTSPPTQPATMPPQQTPPPQTTAPVTPTGTTSNTSAPLTVTVSGPDKVMAGEQITITVTLNRSAVNSVPIDLAVQAPSGTALVSGVPTERIVNADAASIARTYRLRIDRIPTDDFIATADVRGTGYGAHATGQYRFGRPEPKLPQPGLPPIGPGGRP